MTKCLKTGMMNLKYACIECFLFVFINTSSHASPAACVVMEQGTELDPACIRLPRPHTGFKPWQIIVLFCLRYLWLFRSFYYSCLFNLVIAYLSVSSHIVMYFVVVLTYQPTPQNYSHVHRGMVKGLIFLYQHHQVLMWQFSYKPSLEAWHSLLWFWSSPQLSFVSIFVAIWYL
jgi:hypothetical protein